MYFAVNVRLYDSLEALQGLQQVTIILALLIIGYSLFRKKSLSTNAKQFLWVMAAVWVIASVTVYIYSVHNYLHDVRPIYEKENVRQLD